ncbi:hypothetical protein BDR06DRAFT_881053, partial [Suillus hirtellus]
QYLDKGDTCFTSNMWKHVHSCWGNEVLKAGDEAKDANKVCYKIIGSFLQNGLITASFKHKGKGKVIYLHFLSESWTETSAFRVKIVSWVSKSLRPFDIVKDHSFQSLMKTGRPEYYIPSASTVSHDYLSLIKNEYSKHTRNMTEHDSKINFTTDGWSLPNHQVLVAFSAHFKHKREPLSILLDIVEVGKVKKTHLYRYI